MGEDFLNCLGTSGGRPYGNHRDGGAEMERGRTLAYQGGPGRRGVLFYGRPADSGGRRSANFRCQHVAQLADRVGSIWFSKNFYCPCL